MEPFQFAFFRHGILVATLAGGLCGLIGVYVVLRSMSYIGHGLSHAIFGGAVASYVARINFYLGAGVWGLVSALVVHRVSRRRAIGADAAIGVVTTASFAAGVALISHHRLFTRNFEAALFGDVLGVSGRDVVVVAGVGLAALAAVLVAYRRLLFSTFDREVAEVSGLRPDRVDALLSVILAAVILVTMPALGVTMVAAALVTPPVIARMLTNRFSRMLQLSAAAGALSGFAGVYLSFYLDIASGAAVVLVSAALFSAVYAWTGGAPGARRGPGPGRSARRPEPLQAPGQL